MPLKTGTSAPDFTLKTKTAEGLEDVTLSANFGKKATVLLFFPFAFTGVCTQEFCDLTGGVAAYQALDADVLGISVDSPFAQEAWAQKEKITIKLLSDLDKKVIHAYDVVFPGIAGIGDASARAAFVIDKAGKIVYAEQTPTPKDLPNFDALKAALAKIS
jgi:peroxiredoxin